MTYKIEVERGAETGTLRFEHGSVTVETTCWWDPKNRIEPGTYQGYATWMASKPEADGRPCPWKGGARHRPGIWFGEGVKSNGGSQTNHGIYIHKGTSAAWSDGCIVCAATEVVKIWDAIPLKDNANVKIVVTDSAAASVGSSGSGPACGYSCVYRPYHLHGTGFLF